MEEDNPDQTPSALRWVRWLTAAWFVVLAVFVALSQHCLTDAPWWHFHKHYLSCRPANELGDFLAGAFAPIAFLWLVATVLIQAQELRAQRRELALTRQEFEQTREVAKAQAEEARKQAAAMQAQIVHMQIEADERKREAVRAQLDEQLSSLRAWVLEEFQTPIPIRGVKGREVKPLNRDLPVDGEFALVYFCDRLVEVAGWLKKMENEGHRPALVFNRVIIYELMARLRKIAALLEKAPHEMDGEIAGFIDLPQAIESAELIMDYIK